MIKWLNPVVVGQATRMKLADMGYSARLFLRLLSTLGPKIGRASCRERV